MKPDKRSITVHYRLVCATKVIVAENLETHVFSVEPIILKTKTLHEYNNVYAAPISKRLSQVNDNVQFSIVL